MPERLPPNPKGVQANHGYFQDWYDKVRKTINDSSISILWSNINFSGSNLTDLSTRLHNNLQGNQGGAAGEFNHLKNSDYTKVLNLYKIQQLNTNPTVDIIPEGQWQIYKNTVSGELRIWANDAGVLRSVLFS